MKHPIPRITAIAGLAAALTIGVSLPVLATTAPPDSTSTTTATTAPPSTAPATSTALGSTTSTLLPASARTTTPATTTPATTTTTTTTTTTPPPVDLLGGINWIQGTYPSPCGDGTVQVIGGTAIVGAERVILDDVRGLAPNRGFAVAFLSCEQAGGSIRARTAVVVQIAADRSMIGRAEQELPASARVVAFDVPSFTVEYPDGPPPAGGCCAPMIRRQRITMSLDGFVVADVGQFSAFEQTVTPTPAVGADATLVQRSVPGAALCYRWGDVSLYPQDSPDEPEPPTEPSAELQTIRLALIYVTGDWIAPSSEPTPAMGRVVEAYQASRGLDVDGVVGPLTARRLASDLGCPEGAESFRQVDPPALGPRRFQSVADLTAAAARYGGTGQSGNPSLDALLAAARWDGANSMFLGCSRRESPRAGVTCSWSGTTPLQLIGLVDNPDVDGVTTFSVLYARSASAP